MTIKDIRESFSPEHHAIMFAYVSRAIINRVREINGEKVLRKAIQKYGEERGRRMALRVENFGLNPSILNYLAFGEWKAEEGTAEQEILKTEPNLRFKVTKCPWHDTWEKEGLMKYGSYYCMEIDEPISRGCNSSFILNVIYTKPSDLYDCEFEFVASAVDLEKLNKRRQEIGDKSIMKWDYHVGHLYVSLMKVIVEELGDVGRSAMRAALDDFEEKYGQEAAGIVLSYEDVNFNVLP